VSPKAAEKYWSIAPLDAEVEDEKMVNIANN